MAIDDSRRSGLLTAGGILSIIGGAFEVLGGGAMVGSAVSPAIRQVVLYFPNTIQIYWPLTLTRLIAVGVALLVLGVVAIVGGVSAARRKSFGLSLAGAICVLPTVIFGTLAVIFIALSKREFNVEIKENGMANRSWLPIAGGILSIIGGVIELVGMRAWWAMLSYLRVHWVTSEPYILAGWLLGIIIILFVMSLAGGLSAINRKSYRGSIAGAICALPSTIFGVLALVFIVLGKREFEVED